jgi:chloride channel protein, CIC family
MRGRALLRPLRFAFLSVLVGIVGGLGAVVFRGLIAFFHNLLFLGHLSVAYDANVHTPPGPWGPFIILVPVVGALGVAFLVKNFAPEAKGHGVPEVMDAIYYHKGDIRPIVALIKSLASALSIGSGGSVGREGPIIQIGSSFGSTIGQVLKLPPWERITLIAAGAGAGMAATFNTPVGGVLFALEIMMHEVSARTLVPVVISTATATYIGKLVFGPHPSFLVPTLEQPLFGLSRPSFLVASVLLGVVAGLLSALFIHSIYAFEDFFEKRIKGGYYVQHLGGMFVVGLLMYALMATSGHYYIEGVGYAGVQDVLSGAQSGLAMLLILLVLKLVATSLTLGSGASGGIFSPALFLGAMAGGAFGTVWDKLLPGAAISVPGCAIAGMAGVVGGSTGAAVASIVMIFEMTLDYSVVVPMTITVAISYGVRKMICSDSIYTLKLARRGHYMPEALQTNAQFLRRASDILDKRFTILSENEALEKIVARLSNEEENTSFLVSDGKRIKGLLEKDVAWRAITKSRTAIRLKELPLETLVIVRPSATVSEIVETLRSYGALTALVSKDGRSAEAEQVVGIITKGRILDAIASSLELFSDGQLPAGPSSNTA